MSSAKVMDPITVTIGPHEILLHNPVCDKEVKKLAVAYSTNNPPPPLVVATYKRQHLAVNGCHRLRALADLVKRGTLTQSTVWENHILTMAGDDIAKTDSKASDALDWLESQCRNPTDPKFPNLDDAARGQKYMNVCRTLRACSSATTAVKESLRSDAGVGGWGW